MIACACNAWAQSHVFGRYLQYSRSIAVAFDVAGMAGGEPAGFGYWIGVLVGSAGLDVKKEVPKEMRNVFRRLARFLVANDFDHADQLRGGACAYVYSLGWVSVFSGRF